MPFNLIQFQQGLSRFELIVHFGTRDPCAQAVKAVALTRRFSVPAMRC